MRILKVTVLFALASSVVACSASPAAAPPDSTGLTNGEKNEMYTALVQAQDVDLPDSIDLPKAGRTICRFLDDYPSVESIDELFISFVDEVGLESETALALMAPAPGAYCPEHSSLMTEWIGSH
jgi:hypothetical protein